MELTSETVPVEEDGGVTCLGNGAIVVSSLNGCADAYQMWKWPDKLCRHLNGCAVLFDVRPTRN